MRTKTDPEHAIFDAIEARLRAVDQIAKLAVAAKRHPESRVAEWLMRTADTLLAQIEAEGLLAAPEVTPPPPPRRTRRSGKQAALQ
ncbi:hypothetical protein [Brevundimonas sp. Root1279]|uniref:hypothetical protein n=1 Tax=Brevundimonas sp. Root1279 TaxID=1736443 RepID=UPI0006F65ABD|nr:hypothetical protein [Brevundimonas sp. Root1279]KQW82437.1 hypothetical protein ASC65_09335 [Brevundimonas sp. Root1279]